MNRENLLLLATRLDQLPKSYAHFDMTIFADTGAFKVDNPKDITRATLHTCGSVACAVGHGPTIKGLDARKDEDWSEYCERIFGVEYLDNEFEFMFGSDWADTDNTPHGAAKRIRYCVANGAPKKSLWIPETYTNA